MYKNFFMIILLIFSSFSVPLYAGSYTDSTFKIDLFGGIGIVKGDIMDTEHDALSVQVTYEDGHTESGRPDHLDYHLGMFCDISTPVSESKLIQIGIRGMYTYTIIRQDVETGGGVYEIKTWEETLMKFNSLTFGPVFSVHPGGNVDGTMVKRWYHHIFLNYFLLAGPIFGGKLKPAPIARDFDYTLTILPSSSFEGSQINTGIGMGAFFSFFNFGINIYYSWNRIELDKNIYIKIDKQSLMHEGRADFFMGTHM